ncbi:hypothetical protein [Synechococcus sp. MIT S1220]|uniref:hypothetical protein n=1 Tax=Synechococcus sp. MIT S1220 TaxID=3082549 RepID=UPI0039B0018B
MEQLQMMTLALPLDPDVKVARSFLAKLFRGFLEKGKIFLRNPHPLYSSYSLTYTQTMTIKL